MRRCDDLAQLRDNRTELRQACDRRPYVPVLNRRRCVVGCRKLQGFLVARQLCLALAREPTRLGIPLLPEHTREHET